MESPGYEARRKVQNREAQRRYRQKQKQREADTSNNGNDTDNQNSIQGIAGSSSVELQAGAESHGSLDVDINDLFHNSAWPLASPSLAGDNTSLDDLDTFSTAFLTHHSRPEHNDYHHTPNVSGSVPRNRKASLPKTHDLILTKADRMIHDLDRLYDFGVEMQLISPNGELKTTLTNIEALFHKSIHKAAGEGKYHQ